jgi:hypothetical protein
MSKKGRSSVVLLGLVVSALLLVPLIYFALAARIDPVDEEALNEQIEYLQGTAVDSPAALQARFLAERDLDLTFLMPGPEYDINQSGVIAVFDPQDFEGWLDNLEPSELNGVTVYAVTVEEDPETRYTIFRNSLGEVLSTLAPDQNYYPLAWLAAWRPELYAENADPDTRAWYEALCDPARVSVTFYLLPVDSVEDMALARLESMGDGRNIGMNMMMGEGLPEPVTNLVIFAFEQVTNGMALGIGWPEEFTNNLEVFACTNLAPRGWYVASTNLSTAGTNSLWWVDTSITSNTESQFYRVGNADQDTDNDGLTDARERMMYGTAEDNADTDGDGLSDREESQDYLTDPVRSDTDGDGLNDGEEILTYNTDPLDPDSDDDGLSDGVEVHTCLGFDYRVEAATNGWINLPLNAETLREQLPDNNEDDGAVSVSLGFVLPIFGTNCAVVEIGVNGLIEFAAAVDGFSPWENESFPSLYPAPLIAAFWDDLCVFPEDSEMLCATVGSGTSAVFLVEWRNAALVRDPDNTRLTFQAVLEPSGVIRVNYQTLTGIDADGASATFGLQDAKGAAFCQYAYARSASVSNGLSLVYTPGWRFTNPRESDTDTDGVNDGNEVLRDRTDPTNPDRSPPFVYIVTPTDGARKVVLP